MHPSSGQPVGRVFYFFGGALVADFQTGTPATASDGQGSALFTAALLQAALSANRVSCMVALAWEGPQLNTFNCSLGLGERPERVEALAGALGVAAGTDTCRVARAGGKLVIEIPKAIAERKPLKAARLDTLPSPTSTAIPLGITTGGNVQWLDLADERTCHVILGGTTGSGKTCALHWLLYRLLRQNAPRALRMIALDPKRRELAPFTAVPHLLHPVASSPLDIARLLAWVSGELDRRAQTGQVTPRLLIVVEEVADLLVGNAEVASLLARIAQIGRGLHVHLLATTQQPGARSLGDSLPNFPARLIGRVASATLVYGAAGRSRTMADQLLGRGDFLLLTAGDVTRLQMPLLDAGQLASLPRAAQVASLEGELPSLARFADARRDPRGGQGRKDLTPAEYDGITTALEAGASPDELRDRFGIGYERASRIFRQYWGKG
jgi:S-DNA-T family DNA segregation ATPase FtsK/SpoIIIE